MFQFTFTEQMTKDIGAILETGPYRVVAPILAEMQRQITEQNAAAIATANGKDKNSDCGVST